ncbi:hypothetical protein [Corynebacterium ulcerans]|uniref:hypothetical protein n=1 Tax=Corynebacterium ulcerans TaxID=65058 RepID=UPI0034A4C99A
MDKVQAIKIAATYAGAAKTAATSEYERQIADALWYLAFAIAKGFNEQPRSHN